MGSAQSKTLSTEEENKKAARRANYKDVAQDVAGIVISTLEQAASFAPVPYLQQAAGLAITLVDMVQVNLAYFSFTDVSIQQSTSENKSAFKALAADACCLVYTATDVWKNRDENKDGKKIPQDLENHLRELLKTMQDTMDFAKARAARGYLARFVSHKADADRIQGYRLQLKGALDRFSMQSHITVRDAVARIQDQQNTILDALKEHTPTTEGATNGSSQNASVERAPSSKVASDHGRSTLPAPQAPRISPPTPTNFTSFANITNHGSGTFNSINGDHVINNSTTNTSSTNSGNIMNISTVNSNNRYDAGGKECANGRGRYGKGMGFDGAMTKPQAIAKHVQSSGRRGRRRAAGSVPT